MLLSLILPLCRSKAIMESVSVPRVDNVTRSNFSHLSSYGANLYGAILFVSPSAYMTNCFCIDSISTRYTSVCGFHITEQNSNFERTYDVNKTFSVLVLNCPFEIHLMYPMDCRADAVICSMCATKV